MLELANDLRAYIEGDIELMMCVTCPGGSPYRPIV